MGGRAPKKGGGGMCLRYCSGLKGKGFQRTAAGGSIQPGSDGRHGYTRPFSSSTPCADAVLATTKTIRAATANGIA